MSRIEHIGDATLYLGDALEVLKTIPDQTIQSCITSPPYYGLRDYGVAGQLGLEPSPDEYVAKMVAIFREVRRVLRDDGTVWLNLGDSYAGSGKGGNPDDGKQAANKGSQTVVVLYGKTGESARQAAVTNVTRKSHEIGLKPKDLMGIPWRVAFALQADGWYLRQDIIWSKPNPMPESVLDRCTKAHEYIFLLSKNAQYFFDSEAMQEPLASDPENWGRHSNKDPGQQAVNPRPMFGAERGGRDGTEFGNGKTRNRRSVWTVPTAPFREAHFATFPPELIRPCVMAGSPPGGLILDPFSGSGTTGMVALQEGRHYIGIELNPEYQALAIERITPAADQGRLFA